MASTEHYIVIEAHPRWWLHLYLVGVSFFAGLMNVEPNLERVAYWVSRGIHITVKSPRDS